MIKQILTFLLGCGLFPVWMVAQEESASILVASIEKEVMKHVEDHQFSGTVLIAQNGNPIFHQSYGLGYRSTPDTLRNSYHYAIASVTKLFTAIRILQLIDDQILQLDHAVVRYLPQWKESISDAITIHHLLLHISGLPNEKDQLYRHPLKANDFVSSTLKNKTKATIGSFNYNNLDYILLGLIIEAVTGHSWQQEIQTHLLDALQMTQTGFLAYGKYPKHFAYTYSYGKRKQPKQDPFFYIENYYAAGAMFASSNDLLKLDQALYTNQLLSNQALEQLAKSYPEHQYAGYSVWNYQYPFMDSKPFIMERRGGILGANVVLVRLIESNQTIIILSNNDRFNPDSFGDPENLREALIQILAME